MTIQAFDSRNRPVGVQHEDAVQFHVAHPGALAPEIFWCAQDAAHFDQIVHRAYDAGRQKAFSDLRDMIGVAA